MRSQTLYLILQFVVALLRRQHFKEGRAELLWTGRNHVPSVQVLLHLPPEDALIAGAQRSPHTRCALSRRRLLPALLVVEEVDEVQVHFLVLVAGGGEQLLQGVQSVAVVGESDVVSECGASLEVPTGSLGLDEVLHVAGVSQRGHQPGHGGAAGLGSGRWEGPEHLLDGAGLLAAHVVLVVEGLKEKDGGAFDGLLTMVSAHWETRSKMHPVSWPLFYFIPATAS